MFTVSKEKEVNIQLAIKYIKKHKALAGRYSKLEGYYKGNHEILNHKRRKGLPNNRVVVNRAKYIADLSSGYLTGTPVKYKSDENIENITNLLGLAESSVQDSDLALDTAIYGRAFELVYMSDDKEPVPKLAKIAPQSAFVVYDNTVAHNPVFGVVYYPAYNDNDENIGYECTIYAVEFIQEFLIDTKDNIVSQQQAKENAFEMVQLNEFWNNPTCQGDFEPVMSLIDAYNKLTSNRLNDKDQFVDALLALYGATLGDNREEKVENYNAIKEAGTMELPDGAKAEYLTRQFDENSVEILRKALKEDIHTTSFVPDISDEKFSGNSSGVAMSYKILSFELMAKTKERFFKEGLKYRLKLFYNILKLRNQANFKINQIEITMQRSLPSNMQELAEIVSVLQGIVSEETLLSLLPFVENPADEITKLKKEKEESSEYQKSLFVVHDGDTDEDDEE